RDDVQGAVGMPIAASVEAVPDGFAGRGGNRTGPAERGKAGLGSEAIRIVAGSEQQLRRSDVANGVACDEVRCEFVDDGADHDIKVGDLVVQFEIAASERLEGDPIGSFHVAIGSQVRPPGGESANEMTSGHASI